MEAKAHDQDFRLLFYIIGVIQDGLVKVKHGKEQYECEFDTTKDVKTFKAALEKLTGVPPERQTLMSKGCWIGTLKDDKDLSTLKPIKDGHLVTLMGSAAKVSDAPVEVRTSLKFLPPTSWRLLTF